MYVTDDVISWRNSQYIDMSNNSCENVLGLRVAGTEANMLVIMLAWMSQLCDVSFLALTSTEYLWAAATLSTSIGDCWTSVFGAKMYISTFERK